MYIRQHVGMIWCRRTSLRVQSLFTTHQLHCIFLTSTAAISFQVDL